jgi:hypothetical protein
MCGERIFTAVDRLDGGKDSIESAVDSIGVDAHSDIQRDDDRDESKGPDHESPLSLRILIGCPRFGA